MKHTVYYSFLRGANASTDILSIDLDPLLPSVKRELESTDDPALKRFLRCPAFQESVKNTFIFRAPAPLDIKYTGDERGFMVTNMSLTPAEFQTVVQATTLNLLQLFAGSGPLLISENNSLPFSVSPAYYHKTGVSEFPIVTGSFDCGKWFRPLNCAVINLENKDFSIKRGDPLFYIKFHTSDHIELERVAVTDKMLEVTKAATGVQIFIQKTPLKVLYKWFAASKLKSVLLREIKSQL